MSLNRRRAPFRDASLVVIATEGEVTEPHYFNGLVKHGHTRSERVLVEVLPTVDGKSAPKHVLERMDRFTEQNRLKPFDQCWLVLDVDRWPHDQLQTAKHHADRFAWRMAVSNPCFEVWLQLHVVDHAVHTSPRAAKDAWRRLSSDLGDWPFTDANVRAAMGRAGTFDGGHWPPPGSTQVHLLVTELLR